MSILSLEYPKFNSNIYVYRSNLSDWLKDNVVVRNNVELLLLSRDNVKWLDEMLIKYHYKFEGVKKTIDILENDVHMLSS